MLSLQQSVQTQFWAVRDYLAPVLRESRFKQHGQITPEEFVAAGDFLCYKFPTWSWEAGDPSKHRDFLPAKKQYLVSRNVPCLRRASQMVYTDADEDAETMMSFAAEGAVRDGDDEWAVTHTTRKNQTTSLDMGDIPDAADLATTTSIGKLSLTHETSGDGAVLDEEGIPDMDDIPDMDEDGVVEEVDDAAVSATNAGPQEQPQEGAHPVSVGQTNPDNLISVRTYDCLITYDKYYQTPRMWLQGYSPNKAPLTPAQVFSDVSPDYAQKTVTIEPFPHLQSLSLASVHPCKHASVMKKVIERMDEGVRQVQRRAQNASTIPNAGTEPGSLTPAVAAASEKEKKKWGLGGVVKKATGAASKDKKDKGPEGSSEVVAEGLRVDQYLLVFLKFISSVVPTIEIDSTTSV